MATLSEMIILWWLFMASRFPFDYIDQYNYGAKTEGECITASGNILVSGNILLKLFMAP